MSVPFVCPLSPSLKTVVYFGRLKMDETHSEGRDKRKEEVGTTSRDPIIVVLLWVEYICLFVCFRLKVISLRNFLYVLKSLWNSSVFRFWLQRSGEERYSENRVYKLFLDLLRGSERRVNTLFTLLSLTVKCSRRKERRYWSFLLQYSRTL